MRFIFEAKIVKIYFFNIEIKKKKAETKLNIKVKRCYQRYITLNQNNDPKKSAKAKFIKKYKIYKYLKKFFILLIFQKIL